MENINNQKYWDEVWTREGVNTWRVYPQTFNKVVDLIGSQKTVLDLGCGVGILANKIYARDNRVVGLDISKSAIEIMMKEFPGIPGIAVKAPPLPFKTKSFDVVVATEFLEHFEDVGPILNEISRVCKMAIIVVPNNCLSHNECSEHYQKFTKESLLAELKKHFKIVGIDEYVEKFDAKKGIVTNRIALPTLFAVCRN